MKLPVLAVRQILAALQRLGFVERVSASTLRLYDEFASLTLSRARRFKIASYDSIC